MARRAWPGHTAPPGGNACLAPAGIMRYVARTLTNTAYRTPLVGGSLTYAAKEKVKGEGVRMILAPAARGAKGVRTPTEAPHGVKKIFLTPFLRMSPRFTLVKPFAGAVQRNGYPN